jgi:hypothetical protein
MYLGNGYNFHSLSCFITGYAFAANNYQLEKDNYPNLTYFIHGY